MEQAEEEMNVMVEKSLISLNVLRAQLYDRETQNVQFVWILVMQNKLRYLTATIAGAFRHSEFSVLWQSAGQRELRR